jgi:hypothetical protein
MFERSEAYMANITMDALDRDVHINVEVEIVRRGGKLKAWCPETNTYLQFPRAIRVEGKKFLADVIKSSTNGTPFYRAYKGSVREVINGKETDPVA